MVSLPLFGCSLIKTFSGHLYNHAKISKSEYRTVLKVLSEGSPEEARNVFTQIMDTFRAQEIQNFQAVENDSHNEGSVGARQRRAEAAESERSSQPSIN